MTLTNDPVLYVIACAAGPAGQVGRLISDARARGWDPYLIATPAALDFLDVRKLEAQTGPALHVAVFLAGLLSARGSRVKAALRASHAIRTRWLRQP